LAYARFFKKIYQTTGHIFEERFRSPRIAEESYYLQCGRYIERNPVKAKMVSEPWKYPFSSAPYYALKIKDSIITPNPYYLEFGMDEFKRQESYKKFLLLEDPYAPMIDEQLIGY
jgi:putative transposase